MRRSAGQFSRTTKRPQKSRQLSVPPSELWSRGHVKHGVAEWWRTNARQLAAMERISTEPFHLGPSESGLAWIKLADWKTHEPCIAVYTDPGADSGPESLYDPRGAYEKARQRGTPRLSPHGAFRDLTHGDNSAAIAFVERFGPLVVATPATLHAEDLWLLRGSGPPDDEPLHGWWLNLTDFWRRHACYVAILRVWEAFRDPMHKDLRAELREVIRLRDDFASLGLAVDDALAVGLAIATAPVLEDLALAPKPRSTEVADVPMPDEAAWVDSAPASKLSSVALRVIGACLDSAARGAEVRWQPERRPLRAADDAWMRTGNAIARRGVATFTMQLRAGSLWGFLWLFFGLDTGDGIGWRVCPNDGRLFYPPRRDRYYCSAEEQRRATKRESEQRQRRAARRK